MLARNLAQLEQDPAARKAVRREWLKYFEQHPIADLRHYYTFLFPILEQAAAQQWQGLDEFAALFAQRLFIADRYENTRQTGEVLAEYGGQLAEHLAAVIAAPLPPEMLATVEELDIEDGFSPLYAELWPYYDPGCDQMIAVTHTAIADLEHLPKLKRIIGLESLDPPTGLLTELEKRGIEVLTQEERDEKASGL